MPGKPEPIESLDDFMESIKRQQAKTRQVIEETKAWLAEQEGPSERATPSRRRSGPSGGSSSPSPKSK